MKRNKSNFMAIASASVLSIASIGVAGFNTSGTVSAAEVCNPSATTIDAAVCMQDINDQVIASMELEEQYQLVDSRDSKTYYIARLQDGHVWMTQNLALDLSDSIPLTSQNTDLTDHTLAGAYEAGYTYDASTDVTTWTPKNTATTVSLNSNRANVWVLSGEEPHSAKKTDDTSVGHESLGDYYNWTAAIASNDSGALVESTKGDVSNNPQNSICPKGWRLPTVSTESGSTEGSTNEFSRLNVLYNNNSSNNADGLIASPLFFAKAGAIGSEGSYIVNISEMGEYHSSTVFSDRSAGHLQFTGSSVMTNHDYQAFRSYGRSVRCVARAGISPEEPSDEPAEDPTEDPTEEGKGSVSAPDTGANLETSDFSNSSTPILGVLISSIVVAFGFLAFRKRTEEDEK